MVDRLRPHSIRNPGGPDAWCPETLGEISELIEYTDVSALSGTVAVGTVPAGARVTGCEVWVITVFNAGANDALTVGITGDTNYLIENGHPTTVNSETAITNVLDWTPTSDTIVYAYYTHTSTAPTTGKALVKVRFNQPL